MKSDFSKPGTVVFRKDCSRNLTLESLGHDEDYPVWKQANMNLKKRSRRKARLRKTLRDCSVASVHKALGAITLLAIGITLTACSGSETGAGQDAPDDVDYSDIADMPHFTGPWAEEFRYAYARAATEQIRDYLRDEVITEAEKQEVTEAFRTCMVSHRLTFDDFEDGGGYTYGIAAVSSADEANEIATNCENETGVFEVVQMYFLIRANPSNEDRTPEIVACLIRSGVVPQGYPVERHMEGRIDEYALVEMNELQTTENTCNNDPDGAFRG